MSQNMMRFILILGVTLALQSAAGAGSPPPLPSDWRSALGADHPLVGTIWNVGTGTEVSPDRLARAAARADYALLGEKHDNPDHHRLQAWVVASMAASGVRPAVAFEMIGRDQDIALRRYLAAHPEDAGGLGPAIGWEERGWPEWAMYRPIAQAALAAGLPLRPADVEPAVRQNVGRQGYSALDGSRLEALALNRRFAPRLAEALREDLKESHCDLLPPAALEPMSTLQRLRDAVMADSLIAAAAEGGGRAVLIAGNGHVRADRGVPWYLRARLEHPRIMTLAILEVRDGEADWRAYVPDVPAGAPPPFDFVWFTPRIDDTDHCAELAKRLQRHGRKETEESGSPAMRGAAPQ